PAAQSVPSVDGQITTLRPRFTASLRARFRADVSVRADALTLMRIIVSISEGTATIASTPIIPSNNISSMRVKPPCRRCAYIGVIRNRTDPAESLLVQYGVTEFWPRT